MFTFEIQITISPNMARITVEDCVDKFESRFELVLVASNRARKLDSGEFPTVEKDNDKNTVIALREIADETITVDLLKEKLVEEYQIVSPIDEEEFSLENSNSENKNIDTLENEQNTDIFKEDEGQSDISENSENNNNESYADINEDNKSENLL